MNSAHIARIEAAQELLRDGVIYQANLAHALRVAPTSFDDAFAFFAARTNERDIGCAAFVDDGTTTLVSLSPERFLSFDLRARTVSTFPIKGTRPRGKSAVLDDAQKQALLLSEKDRAEHVMIVDLLRNDLSRVCDAKTVTVDALMTLLSNPAVHHLESTIRGRLRDGVTLGQLLRATAPGGSITGAPKSSAIDTIAALEDTRRGPYTGILGVVDARGRGVTSLLIRTWIRPDVGDGLLHVGGGIVVDSEPNDEWNETLSKAASFGPVVLTS
jgi:para-aminobenzoate synthetase component I